MANESFVTDPLDRMDRALLAVLQADGRSSYQDLGRRVGLSGPAVYQRLRRLEARGVVTGFSAILDPAAVGLALAAYLRVRPGSATDVSGLTRRWGVAPAVLECHRLVSDGAFLLKLRVARLAELEAHVDAARGAGCEVTVELVQRTVFESRPLPVAASR